VVKDTENEVAITYVLSRPVLFIGRCGANINPLKKRLADVLGRNIKLLIVEYDPLSMSRTVELKFTKKE
jgi:ribosomal protein S3